MDVERVERIADLVGNARGEQGERIQSLRLNDLLRRAPALGDIAQDHGVANLFAVAGTVSISGVSDSSHGASLAVFDHQRHDVKIDEAICRIKNFHVPTDWPAALSKRFPIETEDALVEAGFTPLFNGKDLDGWEHVGPGKLVIEDGAVIKSFCYMEKSRIGPGS